ncbi:hypothetical protein K458DRAFT_405807 [Lentithecium fluviatile CBS 122367]|uniref:Uncharacterized protein n=1 Tax=Lentithecium fluviatile CBS 122367 TaxID=1168545 RepID=A0A6G1IV82_9PLEO|nr:hypothetical protein K458DRAFT_405807 [Lentithecium fluviatile CBS 122367]
MSSPNSLLDAEWEVDSSYAEISTENSTAKAQATDQAIASAVVPVDSVSNPAEATKIVTSKQESESRNDTQQTMNELVKLRESPHQVTPAKVSEGEVNAQETEARVPAAEESMAGSGDSPAASTDSSKSHADTEASTESYTAFRREASHGRQDGRQECSDLPISIHGDESIIIDDNGGQAIVIDSSDDEMDVDDVSFRQNPRRVSRKRVPPRSPEMVNWTSKNYKARSEANLAATWRKVRRQWRQIYARSNRTLHQILEQFDNEMSDVINFELWNEQYRGDDGRRLQRCWVTYGIEKRTKILGSDRKLVRRLGKLLQRLQAEEEEFQGIALPMDDGDTDDCDYVPIRGH